MQAGHVPAGFRLMKSPDGTESYIGVNGPYYLRIGDNGRVVYGFRGETRHGNPNKVMHGGAVIGFLDTVIGRMIVHETKRNCATISLDTRFVAPAPIGAWIEAHITIKKMTKTMVFAEADALADGELVATASAIFRLFSA
jgi:acyl-coenzyme A thioesterase PaaI-like protein